MMHIARRFGLLSLVFAFSLGITHLIAHGASSPYSSKGPTVRKNDRWVAVVDGYSSGSLFREELQKRGFQVVHVQSSPDVPEELRGSYEPHYYDDHATYSPKRLELILEKLRHHRVEAVFIGTESGVEVGDLLSEKLNLATNGTALSRQRRDKFLMHEELAKKGVRTYARSLVSNFDDAKKWIETNRIPWPLITKPRESAGTQYFRISHNYDELQKHIEETIGKTDLFGTPIREVLLEEYLSGREFAINGVARAGIRYVTDIWEYHKKLSPAGSMIYDRDVLMDAQGREAANLVPYVMSVLEALGIRNGSFHAEVKWDEKRGPLLLEVAARPMGSFQPRVVKLATGSNQIELLIDAFMDSKAFLEKAEKPYRILKNATVIELMSHQRGFVTAFPLLDILNPQALPSYSSHRVGLKVGDWTEVTEDLLASHPGTVFLLHDDLNQIERDYRRIRALEKNGGIVVNDSKIARASDTLRAKCKAFLRRAVKTILGNS